MNEAYPPIESPTPAAAMNEAAKPPSRLRAGIKKGGEDLLIGLANLPSRLLDNKYVFGCIAFVAGTLILTGGYYTWHYFSPEPAEYTSGKIRGFINESGNVLYRLVTPEEQSSPTNTARPS